MACMSARSPLAAVGAAPVCDGRKGALQLSNAAVAAAHKSTIASFLKIIWAPAQSRFPNVVRRWSLSPLEVIETAICAARSQESCPVLATRRSIPGRSKKVQCGSKAAPECTNANTDGWTVPASRLGEACDLAAAAAFQVKQADRLSQ